MKPFTTPEMMELAARGLGRIDRQGLRGAALVSTEEITAMALLLALMGLRPVYPDAYAPASKIPYTEGRQE